MRRGPPGEPGEVAIPFDVVSEVIVVAAALSNSAHRRNLAATLRPEHFHEPRHAAIWSAVLEVERRKLGLDVETLRKLGDVDVAYVGQLRRDYPGPPDNLDFHVDRVLWDSARFAAQPRLNALIEAVRDPNFDPDAVKALGRDLTAAFANYGARRYLVDQDDAVRQMMADVRVRQSGVQSYSYGIPALDYRDDRFGPNGEPVRRLIPGAAPGAMTIVTGQTRIGKSTFIAQMVLGLVRNKRRVLYGAWEMRHNVTLEILAAMTLKWKRSLLHHKGALTPEQLVELEERAHQISKRVRFLELPFDRARGESRKGGNQRNLDVLQGYIVDSKCDVFVGDLFARLLVEMRPEDEVLAVQRMQTMLQETGVHGVLAHQQLTKGDHVRGDRRPTLENAKGSAIWGEAADTGIGIHRAGAHKDVPDDKLEAVLLKQRHGKAPEIIEFDWDAETGLISGGVTKPFDYGLEGGGIGDYFEKGKRK